jgi:hypothetical protein
MAATQILPVASTAADSADVVLASGSRLTIGLKGVVDSAAEVRVFLKDDVNAYNLIGSINGSVLAVEISAPGTYRFSRVAGGTCGVYSA